MSGFCLGAHKVNDMLCEVRVEFAVVVLDTTGAVAVVRSHDDVIFLWCENGDGCFQVSFLRHSENKER